MKRSIPILELGAIVLSIANAALAYNPVAGDFTKDSPQDIRIVTFNVHGEFIDNPSHDAAFARVLQALSPDVIVFQEINSDTTQAAIPGRLDSVLPYGAGAWEVHGGLDTFGMRTVIASRFPLTMKLQDTYPASSTRGVTIALVDLPDGQYLTDIYLLGVHLKCCGDPGGPEDESRQRSADAIAAWLGNARQAGGYVSLPADTPMISLGDFNLVGGPEPDFTLRTGDILDNLTFGPDVKGDWDVSDITDLQPTDPYTGDPDTWPSGTTSPYSRLDRFYYTDSAVAPLHAFVLNTSNMNPAQLAAANLLAGDSSENATSDHLPIAMDLRFLIDCNSNGTNDPFDISAGTSQDCNVNGIPDDCDIAAGASLDGNGDGIPDECQSGGDCNGNGVDDALDLIAGTSPDCNANSVPDECDIASGTSDDCNADGLPDECDGRGDCNNNGVLDVCDLASGVSEDCNVDLVPDDCELATGVFSVTSPQLAPIGNGSPQQYVMPTAPAATGELAMTLTAYSDFGSSSEYIDVYVNEAYVGRVFADGSQCAVDVRHLTMPAATYNAAVDGGDAAVRMVASAMVNPTLCSPRSYITVAIQYATPASEAYPAVAYHDCNANLVPDECDIAGATSADCDLNDLPDDCQPDCNANAVADTCDLAGGTSVDCNANAVPDECDLAGDSEDCNVNGVLDECDIAAGTSIDASGDGIPDECQIDCNTNGLPDSFELSAGRLVRNLTSPAANVDDNFGVSIAIVGDDIAVGAFRDDTGASNAGAVYVFEAATGGLRLTIPNPAPAANDYFGYAVAAVDGNILVGAYGDDTGASNAGIAYLFDGNTGGLLHVLNNPTPASNDWFGISVGGVGSMAVVGARRDDAGATDSGAAYLFDATTGNLVRTFLNPTPAAYDDFGVAVAGLGSDVLIGANLDDTAGVDAGAVYLFDATSGALLRSYYGPAPAAGGEFGIAVGELNGHALIGATRSDCAGADAGAAFLFDATGSLLEVFASPAPAAGALFGASVAAADGRALIGAPGAQIAGVTAGKAYLFEPGAGQVLQTFMPSASSGGESFGQAVAGSLDEVFIGSYGDDLAAASAGAVYVMQTVFDCNGNNVPDECDIEDGVSSDCNADAVPDECDQIAGGDFNADGLVNAADVVGLVDCLAGPEVAPNPSGASCAPTCLAAFDFDGDDDVDLRDFADWQAIAE